MRHHLEIQFQLLKVITFGEGNYFSKKNGGFNRFCFNIYSSGRSPAKMKVKFMLSSSLEGEKKGGKNGEAVAPCCGSQKKPLRRLTVDDKN